MIFSEQNEIRTVLAPDADRYTSSPATDVVSLKYYDHVTFVITEGAGGAGTTKWIAQKCATKAAGSPTAIAANYRTNTYTAAMGTLTTLPTTGVTVAAGANKQIIIEVDAASCGPSYPYVRLHTTEADSTAVDACVIAILSKPSCAGASLPNPLS